MSDLFGAPSGVVAFHQDQDTQVATQERMAQIQHLGALTQQEQMQTKVAGAKLEREQQMLRILAKGPQKVRVDKDGNGITQSDEMIELGSKLTRGGFFKEGDELIKTGSLLQNREAVQKASAIRAQAALDNAKTKKIEDLHNLLASSNDPESFAAAKMLWVNEHPGETLPPELTNYNPSLISALKKATKAGQEEARRKDAEQREKDLIQYRKDADAQRTRHEDALERSRDARQAATERRIAIAEKNAGKHSVSIAGAKDVDIQAAQAMIIRDFPNISPDMPLGKGKDAPLVSSAAYDLANEAKTLVAKTKMSMPEAMTQVYGRMKQNGEFETVDKERSFVDKLLKKDPEKKTAYKPAPAPKPPEAPIPYVPGKTKPEKGKTYTVKGETWRLSDDGKKMVKVE